jgi:hypothetical protein
VEPQQQQQQEQQQEQQQQGQEQQQQQEHCAAVDLAAQPSSGSSAGAAGSKQPCPKAAGSSRAPRAANRSMGQADSASGLGAQGPVQHLQNIKQLVQQLDTAAAAAAGSSQTCSAAEACMQLQGAGPSQRLCVVL